MASKEAKLWKARAKEARRQLEIAIRSHQAIVELRNERIADLEAHPALVAERNERMALLDAKMKASMAAEAGKKQ